MLVKVNSILVPGINEAHMPAIADKCRELGVDLHNIIPLRPVPGTPFENVPEPSPESVEAVRKSCGLVVKQMTHCQRCRADACGLLAEGTSDDTIARIREASVLPARPEEDRPRVAVASREGALVNMHLGEAAELHVFERGHGGFQLFETRRTPPAGGGADRWRELAERLSDCRALLAAGAGPAPKAVLAEHGVTVHEMEGLIETALQDVYEGTTPRMPRRAEFRCGAGCSGNGGGCG
jgi:nitrogen fixation protein NifB